MANIIVRTPGGPTNDHIEDAQWEELGSPCGTSDDGLQLTRQSLLGGLHLALSVIAIAAMWMAIMWFVPLIVFTGFTLEPVTMVYKNNAGLVGLQCKPIGTP